ncbi:MAG: hypothetical protein PHV32_11980 [Eubacteriales bacterium]|nr:hypothetical protein [Eubacteriales bacterium]
MEFDIIRRMMDEPLLTKHDNPQSVVMASVLKAYALMGLSRALDFGVMKEEATVITSEIAKDLASVKELRTLRVPEVDYAICCGIKGEFSVQTYSLSYQTIYKWLRAYVESSDRKRAIESYLQAKNLRQLQTRNEPSPEEQEKIIINGINDSYQTFLELRGKSAGAFPVVVDLGGVKDRYLTNKGLKPASMTLESFYKQCSKMKKSNIL